MLQIAWNSREAFEAAEPCEPQYSPILDKVVEAGILEVRHVDASGRIGKRAADPHGQPLWVSVDAEPTDLRFVLPGPGRYAVVARDHQGRHLGRNDVFAREIGQPDPWRQPTAHERLKDELARERARRRAAEEGARAERARRLEAESTTRQLTAERDRLQRELQREKARAEHHEKATTAERGRRRQAEADLVAERTRKAERERRRQAAADSAAEKTRQPGITAKELMAIGTWAVAAVYYLRRRFEHDDRERTADEKEGRASSPSKGEGEPAPRAGVQTPGKGRSEPTGSSARDPTLDTG